MNCDFCPRQCNVDRDTSKGYCGESDIVRVGRAALHFYEEPIISGTEGSGAIFFSGCNLKCEYCQNFDLSRNKIGKELTVRQLATVMRRLEEDGANNINLVTPSHFYRQIKSALDIYRPNIPIAYNCCGYESEQSIRELEGYVDIYMTDLKYIDSYTAQRYSHCANYFEVCANAISQMSAQLGAAVYDERGILRRGLIIRHLVLPSHVRESVAILEYIRGHYPDAIVSVMFQYVPCGNANRFEEINRSLNTLEIKAVTAAVKRLDFAQGFIQDLSAASTDYIPEFDYTGLEDL